MTVSVETELGTPGELTTMMSLSKTPERVTPGAHASNATFRAGRLIGKVSPFVPRLYTPGMRLIVTGMPTARKLVTAGSASAYVIVRQGVAEAVPAGGRWRLDLSVTLPMAYPEASTMRIGPFELEEGMFHDAAPLLTPYCLEYTWSVWADDPSLHHEGPVRGPLETLSTGLLRALGMRY